MLGAGNVATHISRHLHFAGHSISCVYSGSRESAVRLADELQTSGTDDAREVPNDADFYMIAVPDDKIGEVINTFKGRNGIWLHTSGAKSIEVFQGYLSQFGVLYPLQTLNSGRDISLQDTPFLVEGSSQLIQDTISQLAGAITTDIRIVDSASRLKIHLAAVFANNFSNHMVHLAQQMLDDQEIDVEILLPILKETFLKLEEVRAKDAQTGPALRGDEQTIRKHLELLKDQPELKKLYTFISRSIGDTRKL